MLYRQQGAFNVEMGYLTVLPVSLGVKIGDLYAKDSHSFRNEQMVGLTTLSGTSRTRSRVRPRKPFRQMYPHFC